ncbi:hypothetical protein OsJ_11426 [Oryza sativa Japonica Group]|uniref:Uncharacterized protein n=1 Tax=Oryza sativa subsp. japonica TaxID=39947 RepID=B9F995_ORYSJ|nr:hypothetical protein OsJ_11426 [Oryza sativa Japonica Group]
MTSPGASSFAAALVVEDFPWVKREEEMGMDPDKYREVFDLAQRGARAFRDGHFDEAVSFYSKAQTLRPGDPIILSNRSSAFCMISQVLRERSAADSEYQPLNGLDPTTHAEVALKDAEKVLAIGSNSPRPYLLKAYALILCKYFVNENSCFGNEINTTTMLSWLGTKSQGTPGNFVPERGTGTKRTSFQKRRDHRPNTWSGNGGTRYIEQKMRRGTHPDLHGWRTGHRFKRRVARGITSIDEWHCFSFAAHHCHAKVHKPAHAAAAEQGSSLNGLLSIGDLTSHVSLASSCTYANVLQVLEQYHEAREAILSGLQVDPLSHVLQSWLSDLHRNTSIAARARRPTLDRPDDFECTLCFKLLFEPVTTPCGHSFCRSCLHQSMDHGNKCPMCRTVLFIGPKTYPISVTLSNIIQKNFPEEYAERKSEHETMTYAGVDLMPLFVMDVVLPCQKMALNIFEPRYRLMVRRIMEGNHRMGMVGIDSATGTVADCGCEVEILECEPLPDGRFYLEVEGSRRFRILRSWDQDGYRVAEIEWLQDISLPDGSQERKDLMERANAASELARTYIRRAREISRPARRARQTDLESMPGPQDPEKFSFWLVNLINLRPSDRLDLLRLSDTRERISRSLRLLGDAEQICRVQ